MEEHKIKKEKEESQEKIITLLEDWGKRTEEKIEEKIEEYKKETERQIKELREEIRSKKYPENAGFDPDTESSFGYGRPSFGRSGLVFKEIELSRAESGIYEIVRKLWDEDSSQNEGKGVNAKQVREKDEPKKRSLNLISHYLYKLYQYGYLDRYEGRNGVYYKPI